MVTMVQYNRTAIRIGVTELLQKYRGRVIRGDCTRPSGKIRDIVVVTALYVVTLYLAQGITT